VYSNCLITCIQKKITNPKIEIKKLPYKFHFYCQDDNFTYDFIPTNNKKIAPFKRILFKGRIRTTENSIYTEFIYTELARRSVNNAIKRLSREYSRKINASL